MSSRTDATGRALRVLLSAGEASGDMYGAALIQALRDEATGAGWTGVECFGLGGDQMIAQGFESVVEARNVAVVGLFEVLSHLPGIYRNFHKLLARVDRERPDVAVLIDFPDWNLRLARELHQRGIPVVYYISPQLWAWRKGRVEQVKKYVSKMLVIFPFESEFYAGHNVAAEFVGHPLAEVAQPEIRRERKVIALLPGSRRKEVLMNLPAMVGAVRLLGSAYEYRMPVASTLDRHWMEHQVAAVQHEGEPEVRFTDNARETLASARAAIVASGTATVEAALLETPFVMVYRVSPVTYLVGKNLVKLPFYGMVNLIAGRKVVPELIQHDFTPERIVAELRPLIEDGSARDGMLKNLAEVRSKLRGQVTGSAAHRAANAVLEVASRAKSERD